MMCTSNPYINGKIKTADRQPSQTRYCFYGWTFILSATTVGGGATQQG